MIEELVRKNRSFRRFHQDQVITLETLKWLVNLARLSASAVGVRVLQVTRAALGDGLAGTEGCKSRAEGRDCRNGLQNRDL